MSDEPATASPKAETFHRFLDETGDTTFFGKGRKLILGQGGVSLSFGLDLYDRERYEGSRNYYDKKNPLTAGNKLGPPVT